MLYSVAEISDLIGLSKVSIYKKLKLKEYEEYIVKNKGITYINEIGFNLLKESLKLNEEVKTDLNDKDINIEIATDTEEFKGDLIGLNLLKDDYIETLKKQLEEKDRQINKLTQLIENNQVLLKQEKEVNQLQLESHIQELDLKLNDVKERMEQRREEQEKEQKKGLFERFFK